MPKVNMEMLLPFIEEAFNRGVDFQIPITGTSMNPLLYQNRDFVKIVKPILPLKVGDIPLYRRRDGAFVLHRVVGIRENGEYIMCGDNQFLLEYGITDADIIGIAKILIINGKEIDVDTDSEYLKHKEKYIKNPEKRYPLRRFRYKLHFVKERFLNPKVTGADHSNCNNPENTNGNKPDNTEITRNILKIGSVLVKAIKAQITETELEFPEDTDFNKLYNLAQNHRVTAIIAPSVLKCSFADARIKGAFSKEMFKTSARYTAQDKEREAISREFTNNQIKHCFLKGTKVGKFYDNPDCRFMLDMDLFVEKEKFSKAEELLVKMGYECDSEGDDKDSRYIKKPFLIVELHKELKYDYDKGYDYYKGAFQRMISSNGYEMNMTNEDFFVYILSHTAHHFEVAGTGIKSIVDHYFLKNKLKPQCDEKVLEKSLSDIGLTQFNDNIDALCRFWFEDGEETDFLKEMEEFIILSGVFGNETNLYLNGVAQGRFNESGKAYLLARLFPPLSSMKIRYHILKKCPWLLPVFWCLRIFCSVFDRKRLAQESKMVISTDDNQKDRQKNFLKGMGL